MPGSNEVRIYEELSMNAHPALKTQLYDGWILRFADGYTNRANSVNPIYPAALPASDKIGHCEEIYRRRNLPVVYKLTRELSEDLDQLLADKGYSVMTPTCVMTRDIGSRGRTSTDFYVSHTVEESWIKSYFALNSLTDPRKMSTAEQMLRSIQNPVLCGVIKKGERTVACGLCVIEREYAGLFDIIVDSDYRRQGYGYEICASLLDEAGKQDAGKAYLQVVQANSSAIGLYRKLGFTGLYEYWYRVKTVAAPRE